jgi:hypothetical protein
MEEAKVKQRQFSLAFLFQQVFLIAVLLGLWRIFPRELQLGFEFHSLAVQTFVLILAGGGSGVFFGGFIEKRFGCAIVGCGIGFLVGLYLLWVEIGIGNQV